MFPNLHIIAAVHEANLGIGKDGGIPWKIPEDLKFFKTITIGRGNNAIIMGRKTYESIPEKFRPLTKRLNIVLSKTKQFPYVTNATSFEQALQFLAAEHPNVENVFIAGGEQLYNLVLTKYAYLCKTVYISWVSGKSKGGVDYEADAFFPYSDTQLKAISSSYAVIQSHSLFETVQYCLDIVHPEYQYLNLCKQVLSEGEEKSDRTNVGTYSIFGAKLEFDLGKGFPLLTTKKMFWKGILAELLFFIQGKTNSKELQKQGVNIWKDNTSEKFLRDRGLNWVEGDMGPSYGFQWRHWGAEYKGCNVDYTGQGIDQLANLVENMRKDPYSRRHILSAWNVSDLNQMALPPCHMMAQFNVSSNHQSLSCILYQRSGDLFLGVPFNIASYALLTLMLCKILHLKPGKLIHIIGDCHIYKDHVDAVKTQLSRTPYPFPNVEIQMRTGPGSVKKLEELTPDDITLLDYVSHNTISAPMAV